MSYTRKAWNDSIACDSGTLDSAAFGPGIPPSFHRATDGVADSISRKGNGCDEIARRLLNRDLASGAKPHHKAALLIDAAFGTIEVGQAGRNVQDPAVESR